MAKRTTTLVSADPQGDVVALRERIEAIKGRISLIDEAAMPIEKAHARVDAMVDDLVEAGAIDGSQFAMPHFNPPRLDTASDLLRLIAWLEPDRMKDKLRATVDEFYREWNGGIDNADTRAANERDRAELFELEMEEERVISAAEAIGVRLVRRAEADPRAVMQA